ncbi:hypothetical protein Salat_0654500 [Sesamum alatum]|uniref:Uncharacterized protein n=1 Tax=Sesamum alatum TaxID=300844 RepID=A0AAE2CUC0_9LAMI|nr:hypothetical protein Salat_0654500 [Sesamum alatum]
MAAHSSSRNSVWPPNCAVVEVPLLKNQLAVADFPPEALYPSRRQPLPHRRKVVQWVLFRLMVAGSVVVDRGDGGGQGVVEVSGAVAGVRAGDEGSSAREGNGRVLRRGLREWELLAGEVA